MLADEITAEVSAGADGVLVELPRSTFFNEIGAEQPLGAVAEYSLPG